VDELEELSIQKLKQDLVKTKHELDTSTKQITGL
jgi:hypothetical protein